MSDEKSGKVGKCRRLGRIARQRETGRIGCYRHEVAHLVRIEVGQNGHNTCTEKTCPMSGHQVPQEWD